MIPISPSANNRSLAAAVNGRIRSEGMMLGARAAMWRLGGIGVMLLLAGAGVGAALYGYSFVHDSRTSYQQMANAFAEALDHANLGRVKLDIPDVVIKLDPNATVHLDPAATVHLDSQARVAISNRDVPRPSEHQLVGQGSDRASGAKTVINYTIFTNVPFGTGVVQTGWNFKSSEQQQPSSQFCNYQQDTKDDDSFTNFVVIAREGHLVPNSLAQHFDLDARILAANCVWFDGRATAS